jgi:hypothetical protein
MWKTGEIAISSSPELISLKISILPKKGMKKAAVAVWMSIAGFLIF